MNHRSLVLDGPSWRQRLDRTALTAPWRGWAGVVALGGVTYVLAYLALFISRPDGGQGVLILSDFGEVPLEAIGITLALAVVAREPRRQAKLAWGLFALAFVSDAIGNVIYGAYDLAGQVPFPSVADAFYLGFYPLLLLGLLVLPNASSRKDLLDWRLWLNVTIVIVGGGMALIHFALLPTIAQLNGDPLSTTISLAYPAGDLALLAAVATISSRRPYAGDRRALTFFIIAISAWFFADVSFAILSASGSYAPGGISDVMYIAGDLAFVLAAQASLAGLASPDRDAPGESPRLSRFGPYLMLGLGMATLVSAAAGGPAEIIGLAVLASVLTALVVLRQLLDEERRRRADAASIGRTAQALTGQRQLLALNERLVATLDPQRVLSLIADSLKSVLAYDNLTIYRVDRDAGVLRPILARDRFASLILESTFPMDRGITGWVVTHGEPQCVNDAQLDPRMSLIPGTPAEDESMIVVPLLVGGEVVGTLNVGRMGGAESHFGPADFQMAQLFATQASIALRNAEAHQAVSTLASTDALTGLRNRGAFEADVAALLADQSGQPLTLLMLDLDSFKAFNDRHGHPAGDVLLGTVARAISDAVRAPDRVCRYGGDEFAILLPTTALAVGTQVAERIRAGVAALDSGAGISVTASLGVACNTDDAATRDALVAAGDAALYRAKESGGNQVAVTGRSPAPSTLGARSITGVT